MDMGQFIQQAVTHAQGGRFEDAIRLMESAVQEHPANAHGLGLLGTLLSNAGRHAEAVAHLRKAHELAPQAGHIAYYLGVALVSTDKPLEGLPYMQKAVDLNGSWMPALLGFAQALRGVGDFDRSEAVYRRALSLDPKNPEINGALAAMLIVSGRVAEAVEILRRSALQHPTDVAVFARLTSALNYAGDATPEEVFEAHEHWGRLVMAQGSQPFRFDNARDPEKRLRVGFLSTDLWEHSCAYFLRPILRGRDPAKVEYICYSAGGTPDWMTAELKAAADGWHDVASLDHAALVTRLRDDRLDILVELNGHTANGPLAALRNRAAPVQATYLGYPNTTGLPTIDYRIVDSLTDPGRADQWCTEKLVRLDGCFLCYSPPPTPPGGEPTAPARRPDTPITFGTFNSIRKLGPEVVKLWSRILLEVPTSRLLIKTRGIGTPAARRNFHTAFAAEGVEASRVELLDGIPDKFEHLATYARVDVGLDTFPYNGTTTTCEAMWMGVPVVALEGNMHAGRVGASLLHAVGLPDLVARTQDDYVAIATTLPRDAAHLATLKISLRDRMGRSILCDAHGFAVRFESALRTLWHDWCNAGRDTGSAA
jgi:protein O-GlcNAc transferase